MKDKCISRDFYVSLHEEHKEAVDPQGTKASTASQRMAERQVERWAEEGDPEVCLDETIDATRLVLQETGAVLDQTFRELGEMWGDITANKELLAMVCSSGTDVDTTVKSFVEVKEQASANRKGKGVAGEPMKISEGKGAK
jgi:hypothetical protein